MACTVLRRLWGWEPTCSALHQPSGDSLSALHETRREKSLGMGQKRPRYSANAVLRRYLCKLFVESTAWDYA